ncbi:hypothetical protein ABK040_012844 [Willaertia magna]
MYQKDNHNPNIPTSRFDDRRNNEAPSLNQTDKKRNYEQNPMNNATPSRKTEYQKLYRKNKQKRLRKPFADDEEIYKVGEFEHYYLLNSIPQLADKNEKKQMNALTNEIIHNVNSYLKLKSFNDPDFLYTNKNVISKYTKEFFLKLALNIDTEEIEAEKVFVGKYYEYLFKKKTLPGDLIMKLEQLYNTKKKVSTVSFHYSTYPQTNTPENKIYVYFALRRMDYNGKKQWSLLEKSQTLKIVRLKVLLGIYNYLNPIHIEDDIIKKFETKKELHLNKQKHHRSRKLNNVFENKKLDMKMIDDLRVNQYYLEILEYLNVNNIIESEEYCKIRNELCNIEKDKLIDILDEELRMKFENFRLSVGSTSKDVSLQQFDSDSDVKMDDNEIIVSQVDLNEKLTQKEMIFYFCLCAKIQNIVTKNKNLVLVLQIVFRGSNIRLGLNKGRSLRTSEKNIKYKIDQPPLKENCNELAYILHINNSLGYLLLDIKDFVSLLPFQYVLNKYINSFIEQLNSCHHKNLYLNSYITDILLAKDKNFDDFYTNINFENVDTIVLPINGNKNNNFKQIIFYFRKLNKIVYIDNFSKKYDDCLINEFKNFIIFMYSKCSISLDSNSLQVEKPISKRLRYECDCGVLALAYLDNCVTYEDLKRFEKEKLRYVSSVFAYRKEYCQMFKVENEHRGSYNYEFNDIEIDSNSLDFAIDTLFKLVEEQYYAKVNNFIDYLKENLCAKRQFKSIDEKLLKIFSIYEDIAFTNYCSKKDLVTILMQLNSFGKKHNTCRPLDMDLYKEELLNLFTTMEKSCEDTIISLNNIIVSHIYGGVESYKETEVVNINKQLFPNNNYDYSSLTKYMANNNINITHILSRGIYYIDFEAFLNVDGIVFLLEFTILHLPFNFDTNSFAPLKRTTIYHYFIEYDYYTLEPEDAKENIYHYDGIKTDDKLIINYGFNKYVLDHKFIKSYEWIYRCFTRIPLVHEYERKKLLNHKCNVILNRKAIGYKIKELINSGVCFAKDTRMEVQLFSLFEKECGIELPKLFDIYKLMSEVGYEDEEGALNSSIKDNQEKVFSDHSCKFHYSVPRYLKKGLAYCSQKNVITYADEAIRFKAL